MPVFSYLPVKIAKCNKIFLKQRRPLVTVRLVSARSGEGGTQVHGYLLAEPPKQAGEAFSHPFYLTVTFSPLHCHNSFRINFFYFLNHDDTSWEKTREFIGATRMQCISQTKTVETLFRGHPSLRSKLADRTRGTRKISSFAPDPPPPLLPRKKKKIGACAAEDNLETRARVLPIDAFAEWSLG